MNNVWEKIKQWVKETMTEECYQGQPCQSLSETIPESEIKYILHIPVVYTNIKAGMKRYYGISVESDEVEETIVVHVFKDRSYKVWEEGFCKIYGRFEQKHKHVLEAYRLSGDVSLIAPYITWMNKR